MERRKGGITGMKRIGGLILIMFGFMALLGGCGKGTKETITNRNIPPDDVTEFYYTVENLNYNAFYQRYHFYKENGKYLFHHETRERHDQYGPTTEADITNSGTFELTADEWKDFLAHLKDGTVCARKDSAESGSSGPWMFIYWKNDKGKDQVFEFPTYDARAQFADYCASLAQSERQASDRDGVREDNMKGIRIRSISYSPGYGDMNGQYHQITLEKDENGSWTYVCSDRKDHSSSTVTAVYGVSDEALERLEMLISEKNILSLQNRPESDLFATDYSPWSWRIDYETTSAGKTKREYCGIEEYHQYSEQDYELLKELNEHFTALRAEKISETSEKR